MRTSLRYLGSGMQEGDGAWPRRPPCEYLFALGKRCIPLLAETMTKWSADLGNITLPTVWQISRLALIPKGANKCGVAHLRPVGLVSALQTVAARSLLGEDVLPQTVNASGFRRGSDIALAVMPVRLLAEHHREMGHQLAM